MVNNEKYRLEVFGVSDSWSHDSLFTRTGCVFLNPEPGKFLKVRLQIRSDIQLNIKEFEAASYEKMNVNNEFWTFDFQTLILYK